MDTILDGLTHYYGLDWATMAIGLYGTYLITQQKRLGFLLNAIACLMGLVLAGMADQMGYIAYNGIILCMLTRAFINWPKVRLAASID